MTERKPLPLPPSAEPLLEAPASASEPLLPAPQPIESLPSGLKHPKKRLIWLILGGILLFLIVVVLVIAALFHHELSALAPDSKQSITVDIKQGMAPPAIGQLLQTKKVIRSASVFDVYTRLSRSRSNLQAGVYHLSPADSTPEIITQLEQGNIATFNIEFLPGATLAQDEQVLQKAGFSDSDIQAALSQSYTSPVLAGKPAGASLEGYLYGQKYNFNSGQTTVNAILQRAIDELNTDVQQDNIQAGLTAHNLSLFQGITLASIVQREDGNAADQKQIAAVFYNRLAAGMPLGSDVTYQYGASLLGVAASPDLDSPYNTRINPGLPPGPISSPGKTALEAVAYPASNDYLYFLSGDDGKLYFSTTEAGHEQNIADHCQKKCQLN